MQILHNATGVNCTFHTRQNPAKFGATSSGVPGHILVGRPERKAPGAKSGFAFPGTSALYVTLTQIPTRRIDSVVCVCVHAIVCFLFVSLAGHLKAL
jgi:hypothetical protein